MSIVVTKSSSVDTQDKRAALAERLRQVLAAPTSAPLSFAQQRLWFLDQLQPNVPLYNVVALSALKGQLDVPALQFAISAIVARHDTLRTRFLSTTDLPEQSISPGCEVTVALRDFSASPCPQDSVQQAIREEANRPFRLDQDQLLRVSLFRIDLNCHVLMLVVHHIIFDEWSLGIFYKELGAFYESKRLNKTSKLEPLSIQYGDYAVWERDWLKTEEATRQLQYWERRLADLKTVTELPTDHKRPAIPAFRGHSASTVLSTETVVALHDYADKKSVTVFMVLLAAFKALVHRYSGRNDIIIGTPIAGRNRVETEDLIGFFVNTLMLRSEVSSEISFNELLTRVRDVTLGAWACQDLPFNKVVEVLQPERSLSHMPFTRLMFALQNDSFRPPQLAGLETEPLRTDFEMAKFDLTLIAEIQGSKVTISAEYDADLFNPATILRFLAHYKALLSGALKHPNQTISRLTFLTQSEIACLQAWNRTETDFPRDKCVHEIFESWVEQAPQSIAVRFGQVSLTYRELNDRANRLAHWLLQNGVRAGVPVGLCLPRSIEMIVSILAVVKAGGIYVPLDPGYPLDRVHFIITDTGCQLVLTLEAFLSRLPASLPGSLCLDRDERLFNGCIATNPSGTCYSPQQAAYIIYTSGSTGKPKGVVVPHLAINRLVLKTDYVSLQQADRIAHASNVSFDAATFEIWGALLNGSQIAGISCSVTLSPSDFAQELRRQQVTVLFLTTALFNQFAAESPGSLGHIQTVMFGGEQVDPRAVRKVLRAGPPARLLHVYGPTENTTFSTWHLVQEVPGESSTVPIGRPIANTTCHVLDSVGNPVPEGVVGELYVGGDGLALGYWNRPELTDAAFVLSPVASISKDARLYKTGDLVKRLSDGSIEFVGRADNQIKIRGFRVELGEVEAALVQHPSVEESVVKVYGESSSDKRLVAYITSRTTPPPGTTELRRFLSERLPDYMVPAVFTHLLELPINANGKVDRAALPAPDQARPDLDRRYIAPRDPVEAKVAAIWESTLGIQPIGVKDKFFELGGHSLLAVQLISRIDKAFGRTFRVATVFQAPTIEEMAAILRTGTPDKPVRDTSLVQIQPHGSKPPLFLVHGAGGGMFWGYANLSRALGLDQPVIGFKSRGLDGNPDYSSIEEMAAKYISDLKAIQPAGPYFIGGYCFGGNVAYEMARQLQERGDKVALLALFNCAPANSGYGKMQLTPLWAMRFLRNMVYWGQYFFSWSETQRREFFRWKWDVLKRRLRAIRPASKHSLSGVEAGNLVDLSSFSAEERSLWETHIQALVNYHPRPFPGKVHLFRSPGHPLWCSFEPDYGWGEFAGTGVETIIVPGAHERILEEPCVTDLANKLTRVLERDTLSDGTPHERKRVGFLKHAFVKTSLFIAGAQWLADQLGLTGTPPDALSLAAVMPLLKLNGSPQPAPAVQETDAQQRPSVPSEPDLSPSRSLRPECCHTCALNGNDLEKLGLIANQNNCSLLAVVLIAFKSLLIRYGNRPGDVENSVLIPGHRIDLQSATHPLACWKASGRWEDLSIPEALLHISPPPQLDGGKELTLLEGNLAPEPLAVGNGSDCAAQRLEITCKTEQSALTLKLLAVGKDWDSPALGRILSHLQRLLLQLSATPERPMLSIDILPPDERRSVLYDLNKTGANYEISGSYAYYFSVQARKSPKAVAVRYEDQQLTYGELEAQANRLARYLQSQGVGPEVLVGICMERDLNLIISILATWKAGGAYVPLDPSYPSERLAYMVEDSKPHLVLCQERVRSRITVYPERLVSIDDSQFLLGLKRYACTSAVKSSGPDNLAYVIYTSGSTGNPKGVQISHRSLLNHNFAIRDLFSLSELDRVLQFAAISFDISVEEIFPTLLSGAALILRTDASLTSCDRMLELLRAESVSVLNFPTAYWHEFVGRLKANSLPKSVRLVVIGGEKASQDTFLKWQAYVSPKVRLINSYGPTEATVTATVHEPTPQDRELSIGRPLPNVSTLILDSRLHLAPLGVPGELYLGGAGLARGYLNRPELTAERFVPNPFKDDIVSALLYKTGDLVCLRPDGNIQFIGRVDHQVKWRGYRIELGEIETALKSHPDIKEAIVVIREDVPGHKQLAGYFLPEPDAQVTEQDLLHHLKQKLPGHMVPSRLARLGSLPLTPAGKVDRRNLPPLGNARPDLQQPYVAPRTALEEALASIWKEVLGLDQVGVLDPFFELGGHSLSAIQVVSRIQDGLHVSIPLASLFELPTIASMADYLVKDSAHKPSLLSSIIFGDGQTLPLSGEELRMWFLDQFDPHDTPFNLSLVVDIRGPLDTKILRDCLSEIAASDAKLRSVYPIEAGLPIRYVPNAPIPAVDIFSLEQFPPHERTSRSEQLIRETSRRSQLTHSPLLRALLIRLAENDHRLLLLSHVIGSGQQLLETILDKLVERYSEKSPSTLSFTRCLSPSLPCVEPHRGQVLHQFWVALNQGAASTLLAPSTSGSTPDVSSARGDRQNTTLIEESLHEIWRQVFPSSTGTHDDFFSLRGNTSQLLQLILRIREVFKVELPLRSIFEAPSVPQLSNGLLSGKWTPRQQLQIPLKTSPWEDLVPVSFVQERLWFLDQLQPGSDAYNISTALRLRGKLNREALQQSLNRIMDRHRVLRGCFRYTNEHLVQSLNTHSEVRIVEARLPRDLDPSSSNAVQDWIDREAQRPFNLETGPLIRAHLLSVSDREHIALMVVHHSVADGWSLTIFFRELQAFYSAYSRRQPPPRLPQPQIQYADYARWQREYISGEFLQREVKFWKSMLVGAPAAINLPSDPLPITPPQKAGRVLLHLPPELHTASLAFTRAEGVTPFVLFMTTLNLTLSCWTGQKDLVVGTVVAGRNRRELEGVIGCFMNFLPIRTRLFGVDNGRQLLERVRDSVLQAQAHQECPFEKLVESINPERKTDQNPLYNVALLLQNFPGDVFQGEGLAVERLSASNHDPLLDLRFEIEETHSGFSIACEYRAERFHRVTVEQFLHSYIGVIEKLVRNPAAPLTDFSLTGALTPTAEKKLNQLQEQTLAVTATFTAEPIEAALRYWMAELDIPATVSFAGYNQVFQELLHPSSILARNDRGLNVLLVRLEDWNQHSEQLQRNAHELVSSVKSAASRFRVPTLLCFCPPSPGFIADQQACSLLSQMETQITGELQDLAGVYVVSTSTLMDLYPVQDYFDSRSVELAHVPYTEEFFTALGTVVARRFHALLRPAIKVIVLDCDNTLWRGVCAEDGPQGIMLDEPWLRLQDFMLAQRGTGKLLCLCSKNSEQDVLDVFSNRPDMPLQEQHFATMRLNWQPKSENLRSIARELNLGLESFLFLDDNPVECAEVEANCPEVLTLLLPENTASIPAFLKHCWALDHLKTTAEDRSRNEMYRQNSEREKLRSEVTNLEDFITGLNLDIQISSMTPEALPRIAQLTLRTNQFNFTTRRYSEEQIKSLAETHHVLSVHVRDRFGDYGLVGVVICSAQSHSLLVDSFLLSCRVLGRGVEYRILSHLGELAQKEGLSIIQLRFIPSTRNKPAFDFLKNIGAESTEANSGEQIFTLDTPAALRAQLKATLPPQNVETRGQPLVPKSAATSKFTACRRIAMMSDISTIHAQAQSSQRFHSSRRAPYVPPKSTIERQICEIWQKLLRVERVGLEDNFFDLGGHSLMAVRLFADLEKVTSHKLPLVTVFQAPTVRRLAEVLSQELQSKPQSLVVAVQPHGFKPPLFLVHGAGGDVLWGYANLARQLGDDQPLYCIKSRGQVGLEEIGDLPGMAACYIEEIRTIQKKGPYYLGGYCFGGNVAYEMARQLTAQGEEVALVVLLDSSPSNAGYETVPWWRPGFLPKFFRNFGFWMRDFSELDRREQLNFVGRKSKALLRKIGQSFSRRQEQHVDLQEVINQNHFPEHELRLWQIHLNALVRHTDLTYGGKVVLLRTRGQPLFCSLEDDFCWSKIASDFHLKFVPGSHENVFVEPHVRSLARDLAFCLSDARTSEKMSKSTALPVLS